jgi:hypothetical protein
MHRAGWMLLLAAACDSPEEQRPRAQAPPTASVPSEPSAAPAPPPPVQKRRRPEHRGDLILDSARRARIEAAHPEAKGFLDLDALEKELFTLELKRGSADKALAAFDKRARGKWVLFASRLVETQGEAAHLTVHYTPSDPKDPLGLTSTWFAVRCESIAGYLAGDYKPGELMVVLAKYQGKKRAGPGHDLVASQLWFREP